jgi:sulfite exporter TauE/SafE
MDVRQTGTRPAGGLLTHLVQATHVTAFWLLALPLSAVVMTVALAFLLAVGLIRAEDVQRWDEPVWTVMTRVAVAAYVVGCVRQVYRATWTSAIIRGGIVGLLLIPCLQVYRAVLFILAFYTT